MSRSREERKSSSRRVETWQLRAKFASALSRMYGAEVPELFAASPELRGRVERFLAERQLFDPALIAEARRIAAAAVAADITGVTTTHINHLTPRVLDIDELYRRMTALGMLLRQTARSSPAASAGLAYYHGGDPSKPVVYEDFLPASAAGIFRSNLDTDAQKSAGEEDRDNPVYNANWMAGQIGQHIHDPYELYEKVASS